LAVTLNAAEVDTTLISSRHVEATPLVEGPNDANIVRFVAQLLQRQHYLRMEIDDEVSSRFLDRYLDSLDNLHIYFIHSDLREFEKYRYKLDEMTVKHGDTTPARLVFNRWRERLEQQYEYVHELLKEDKFDFATNDRFVIDRKKLPRPADLAEA
jgi:carboxyl-terminal processing protease